jgi:hypothetical protein
MMLKKEREVIFLLEKHLDEIKEWLKISSEALSYYLSDLDHWQKSRLNDCTHSISRISSQAVEANDQIQLIMVKIVL